MSTALQHIPGGAVAGTDDAPQLPGQFSREQIELLKRTVAEGTSDDELALFLEVCKSTGLNPFQRQIYAIVRETWNPRTRRREPKMNIQTGIDGYRLVASRTGQHAGTSDVEFGPTNSEGYPTWARVTVYRIVGGRPCEFVATARWDEYVQRKRGEGGKPGAVTEMWERMPHTMLGKCAESLALRRAFPAELAGVYTREEMMQATVEDAEVVGADERPQLRPARRPPDTFPGASMYGGKEPGQAAEDVTDARVGDVDPDAVAVALDERLALVDTADGETLRRWLDAAKDASGLCEGWPTTARRRLHEAVVAEGRRRKNEGGA